MRIDARQPRACPLTLSVRDSPIAYVRTVRSLQTSVATAQRVTPGPNPLSGEIVSSGDQEWYSFDAVAGASYSIETQLQTLDDTMVDLVDTDGTTIILENDDDERSTNSYASYIEWTCPAE